MNCAEEVSGGFVIAGCYRPELLELGEEILDQVARLVEVSVVVSDSLAVGLGRDDNALACCGKRFNHAFISVERFVGNQRVGLHVCEQMVGACQVMRLASRQEKAGRVAQRIDDGVDLGARPASGATDGLIRSGFFGAPALC